MIELVKINKKDYREINYSSPKLYEKIKNATNYIKINFLTIPRYVIEETVAIMYNIAGSETGEKKQVEILYMGEISSLNAKVIEDITDDEAKLMGYKNKHVYIERIQKHFNIQDTQRLCIVTEFKKIKNLEDDFEE